MTTARDAAQGRGEDTPEPHWPALTTLFAVAGIYWALPRSLTFGPRGLLLEVVCALLIPTFISAKYDHHHALRRLGFLILGVVTFAMLGSLILLIRGLPTHAETPVTLLHSSVALWTTNVIVFAQWYWRLDAGGPIVRGKTLGHVDGAFLFPQMTMSEEARRLAGEENWAPIFVDYLFLAFNTSTAFSPTDTMALSRWAKALMMIQAIISLAIIVLLLGRVVNIF